MGALRYFAAAIALAMLVGCDRQPSLADKGRDMLAWSKANPPVSAATWASAGTLECRAERKNVCEPEGCKTMPTTTWVRVTPSTGAYQRCDAKGCDSYQASVSHSGSWTTIALPGNATFLRLTASRQFYEVATLNQAVYIYHGQCQTGD